MAQPQRNVVVPPPEPSPLVGEGEGESISISSSSAGGGAGPGLAAPISVGPTHNPPSQAQAQARARHGDPNLSWVKPLIQGLASDESREQCLELLCKNRQVCDDLAILLWNSFGIMKSLLKEITSVYRPLLSTGPDDREMKRVCNAIALLQPVAAHPDTRMPFITANIPVYLYPFLNTVKREKPYESLRLTSLGVIGSLVKVDDTQVVNFLLFTQVFPSCLRCMEVGGTLSKTVATFIIYRILLNEEGQKYCFVIAERFLSINRVLGNMIDKLPEEDPQHSPRLLKNIISCYLLLSENDRISHDLSSYIPRKLIDDTYIGYLQAEPEARNKLRQLIHNLKISQRNVKQSTGNGESPGLLIG